MKTAKEYLDSMEKILEDVMDKIQQIKDNLERSITILNMMDKNIQSARDEAFKAAESAAKPLLTRHYISINNSKRRKARRK